MLSKLLKCSCASKPLSYAYNSPDFSELIIRHEIKVHLASAESKTPRSIKKRDSSYLSQQAQGLFINKPSQIFVNPTDHQLDKIFSGKLWGYKHGTIH